MADPKKCIIYLKRMQYFLDLLGNPEKQIPHYIHVTGTSGKGSTTAYMHQILHEAGYTVGSTYSPHPSTIRERWRVGNTYMSEKEFVSLVSYIQPYLDTYIQQSPYDTPSFFELMEVIGFLWFVQKKVTWVVLEVGCGGRYDSSNVIPHKDVAIITNIGLDHVGIIGNNKKEIAYEKAGIIKKNTHVVSAEKNNTIFSIIKKEATLQQAASLTRITSNKAVIKKQTLQGTTFSYKKINYHVSTPGNHQVQNALICIEAAEKLQIPTQAIQQGLQNTPQPLRLEIVNHTPTIILDGAHNDDKILSTVETLLQYKKQARVKDIHLVVGFSDDKQINSMIRTLVRLQPKTVACTRNTVNPFRKVASPKKIQQLFKRYSPSTKANIFINPHTAFDWSKSQQKKNDILLVTGSIFLSGEIRAILGKD